MNSADFDCSILLDGSQSPSTYSTTTTTTASPLTTESDADSGIAHTPVMPEGFDTTTIDLDNLDLDFVLQDIQFPISDDPNDNFDDFASELFDGNNALSNDKNSTFESLFSSPINPVEQQAPSTIVPAINNCIKIQSPTPIGASIIKLEPINSSIRLIPVAQPTTTIVTTAASPSGKRRRGESPEPQTINSTLTLEKLRAQYGNLSEEALKKHLRMIKNRESASLSRKRRKEYMENLDVENKKLADENERLKKQNAQLLTRIHTLEVENELLKQYTPARKSIKIMGIFLLVGFGLLFFRPLSPTNQIGNRLPVYDNPGAVVPSRTILNERSIDSSFSNRQIADGSPPTYPYMQCVAFINKTHSQRINQDLRSWMQTNENKVQETKPVIIPDPKSVVVAAPVQRPTRKVARQINSRVQPASKGQLEPYRTTEINYEDFFRTIERKNDTLYFISFKRDQLVLPALSQNQTQRPKMSLILPASMANLNKSIHVPNDHIPMMKIDCEVDDTKLVFVQQSQIPSAYRDDLLQYYSSSPQATI